jgi:hypothetical protein
MITKLCVNTFIIEIKLLEQPELEKEIHSRIWTSVKRKQCFKRNEE